MRKPEESGTIVPERDSRIGAGVKAGAGAGAGAVTGDAKSKSITSEATFDRFESLDISSTEGEAVKFSDSEEDTTSEPVVIQPLTR